MMTPAQYWISGGRLGGGLGDSSSDELCRYVNRSTRAKTFVIRGGTAPLPLAAVFGPDAELEPAVEADDDDDARSFSFPRPVALLNAFTSGCTSRLELELEMAADEDAATERDDDEDWPYLPSFESCAVAG